MESVFIIGCSLKEQIRIQSFLEGSYAVRANPLVTTGLERNEKEPSDLLIYDTDNSIPLRFFVEQVRAQSATRPIAVLSSTRDMVEIEKMLKLGVASIIKKPCSKKGLLKGIQEGLAKKIEPPEHPQDEAGAFSIRKTEAEVLIGLRKKAVISRIRKEGISFLLPASLEVGAKMMFRNADFLELIGRQKEFYPVMEIEVIACSEISEYQFQVDAVFTDDHGRALRKPLQTFVETNSVSRKVSSTLKTIVLAEPDSFTRNFFCIELEKKGYRVVPAESGFQVLDLLEKSTADLLICELLLPKLSGQESIEILKKRDNRIPIIVATGETNPSVVRELKPMVQAFLTKPISGKTLTGSVAETFQTWNEEAAKSPAKGDVFVEVHLETNLLVAFRDQIKLLSIGPNGLTFSRNGPIAPGTRIFAKTDAISLKSEEGDKKFLSLELKVVNCSTPVGSHTCIVDAEFVSGHRGAA